MIGLFSFSEWNLPALPTLQSLALAAVAVGSCIQPAINGHKEILVKSNANGPSIAGQTACIALSPGFALFLFFPFTCTLFGKMDVKKVVIEPTAECEPWWLLQSASPCMLNCWTQSRSHECVNMWHKLRFGCGSLQHSDAPHRTVWQCFLRQATLLTLS